jgi:hypothetical protein
MEYTKWRKLPVTMGNSRTRSHYFSAALKDPVLDIPVAVALAIHNIPEGIAVLIPAYYATGNRSKMKVIL